MKNIRIKAKLLTALLSAAMLMTAAGCGSQSAAPSSTAPSPSAANTPANAATSAASSTAASSDVSGKESPMLEARVAAGELPPLEERLPENPKVLNELAPEHLTLELGAYGGTLRTASTGAMGAAIQTGSFEPLINSPSFTAEEFVPNVAESWSVNEDATVYTFTLRKGMKWSDGEPLTTADVDFAINDVMFNTDITSAVPNNYRTGGVATGNPMTLTIQDEYTFTLTFDGPYHGFPIKLAVQSWPSYEDLIKPAHYLKQFHKDYIDEAALAAMVEEAGQEADQWGVVFSEHVFTGWTLHVPGAVGFPTLTPFIPVSSSPERVVYERNPYYFKVDAEGRQVPYIDEVETLVANDAEVALGMVLAGQLDMPGGEVKNMALYKEHEEDGGYTANVANYHGRLGNIYLNLNYDDPNWQSVINDVRFRKAVSLAVNRAEISDTVFFGIGILADKIGYGEYDPAAANALLDELGLTERNADGMRLYPDGSVVEINFDAVDRVPENLPITEMLVPMLREVGINASFREMATTIWSEALPANECHAFVERMETYWWMADAKFSYWCPTWWAWYTSNGATGDEPPAEVIELMDYASQTTSLPIENEGPAAYEKLVNGVKEGYWYLPIFDDSQLPLIFNKNLGNTDIQGDLTTIITTFTIEQMFFRQ